MYFYTLIITVDQTQLLKIYFLQSSITIVSVGHISVCN